MTRAWIAITLCLCAAAAELETNTVTVTAGRAVSQPPDQVWLYVSLLARPDTGLEDIVAQLKGTGITAADLNYVTTASGDYLQWTFTPSVGFDKLAATIAALTQAQATLGNIADKRTPALDFYIS